MNIKISLITSTHNAYNQDFSVLENLLDSNGIALEIIRVNDPYGSFHLNNINCRNMRTITPPKGLGYFNSLRFGLLQTTGSYIYFLSEDTKLNDLSFFSQAVKKLNEDADLVFSRSEVSTAGHGNYIMKHPFKEQYTPAEFLREWYNLRMIFVDYFSFSSFMFRKDMLMAAEAFISSFPDAVSLDTATIIKSILLSRNIAFVDCVTATRHFRSGGRDVNDKSNMTAQVVNHFAIPLDVTSFIKKLDLSHELITEMKTFFNQYAVYSFNAITSDFYQTSNEVIFDCMDFEELLKNRDVYIYGRGWVGLALVEYLKNAGIGVRSFIDDFKAGEGIITFDQFKNEEHRNTSVIIASYKCTDVFRIYKKLQTVGGLNIIDLLRA